MNHTYLGSLKPHLRHLAVSFAVALGASLALVTPSQGQLAGQALESSSSSNGPIRLRQPSAGTGSPNRADASNAANFDGRGMVSQQPPQAVVGTKPVAPTDFELYVRRQAGSATDVRRFGAELLPQVLDTQDATEYNPLVPADYLIRTGDEVVVTLWGSVDADLRLVVDRSGRITIPRVGPVMVSGVRYSELPDVLARRVGQVFKNFQLSVSLGQLRGIRVFVTGFVQQPGAMVVSSLSTLAQAVLKAGGPSAAGSFRSIQLRRGKANISTFDLYDLLTRGDRTGDALLQADDVIHVDPVGPQVALIGSVNRQAIFELKAGETVQDLLRLGGSFSAVADKSRLSLERFSDRTTGRLTQLQVPENAKTELHNGDVLRAFNAAELAQPTEQRNKRVRIEGEVIKPGEYLLPPASSIADLVNVAGGLSGSAFLYAAEFTRESVRLNQQRNYERALRDLETQLGVNVATRRTSTSDEAASVTAASQANARLIEQLRAQRPSGRMVLNMQPGAGALPDLALEDGDRLVVPQRPTTVGVFGSVFSAGSYLFSSGRSVGDYLKLAGGPTKGADSASVFVIRANGTVSSSLQETTFWSRGNQIERLAAEPGDTIFVPEEMDKSTWVQNAKDWTQILYQFGIGIAGIVSATK